ncbi:Uncharacterized membrane protein [Nonlabens sp. Hel1_33_55]|uniref:DUF368 domain-containing protein n=1 Tax=Nonlabens sp. Hel1_33_55 TaxID=1336802 RepID=UPI000875C890|nr:DUF368 domain-containing protein [Nonlabens sp. Hel1_33_55]SCY07766.1 Uncharacterized membrane protein [Nonlabens sp. Hel1_33_55]
MRQPTRNLSDKFYLVLKGMAMGTANKVPGVSGGIVAYVAGFYEEFIYSFQKLNFKALKLLASGRLRSFMYYINGRFLGLLILGELISYFTVSLGFDVLISYFPILVWSAFFGMILGSIYYLTRSYEDWTSRKVMFLMVGALVGIGTSLLDPATQNTNLFFVFFCGMVSISGMTLPGLSGSYLLILFGNYVLLMVDSVNAFLNAVVLSLQGDFTWWYDPMQTELLLILLVFVGGSIAGLISFSHLLGWTFKHYRDETNATIIGFITGSLGVVWPWKREVFKINELGIALLDNNGNRIVENYQRYWPSITSGHTWVAILLIGVGFAIVYLLDHYGNRANPA